MGALARGVLQSAARSPLERATCTPRALPPEAPMSAVSGATSKSQGSSGSHPSSPSSPSSSSNKSTQSSSSSQSQGSKTKDTFESGSGTKKQVDIGGGQGSAQVSHDLKTGETKKSGGV